MPDSTPDSPTLAGPFKDNVTTLETTKTWFVAAKTFSLDGDGGISMVIRGQLASSIAPTKLVMHRK